MAKVRQFMFDLALDDDDIPVAGDIITGARAIYRITEISPVESRIWPNRWRLRIQRIGTRPSPDAEVVLGPEDAGARVFYSRAYRRGEGPVDTFGPPPEPAV